MASAKPQLRYRGTEPRFFSFVSCHFRDLETYLEAIEVWNLAMKIGDEFGKLCRGALNIYM